MTGIFASITSALLKCVNLVCRKTAAPLSRDDGDCLVIVVGASLLEVNVDGHAPDYQHCHDILVGALHGRPSALVGPIWSAPTSRVLEGGQVFYAEGRWYLIKFVSVPTRS
jgi:hypothetical protein